MRALLPPNTPLGEQTCRELAREDNKSYTRVYHYKAHVKQSNSFLTVSTIRLAQDDLMILFMLFGDDHAIFTLTYAGHGSVLSGCVLIMCHDQSINSDNIV